MLASMTLDFYLCSSSSRDRSGNEDFSRFRENLNNLKILNSYSCITHTASHTHTFYHASSRSTTSSNGTSFTFAVLLTVASRTSLETMSFYHTLETFTFRKTRDSYHFSFRDSFDTFGLH